MLSQSTDFDVLDPPDAFELPVGEGEYQFFTVPDDTIVRPEEYNVIRRLRNP